MAKRQGKIPEVVDVPENGETALMTTETTVLQAFFGGLRKFLTEARALEQAARQTLGRAKTWKRPTSKLEDEVIVERVRQVSADIHAAEAHWQITQLMSRLHGRMTDGRGRTTKPLQEAKAIGTALHNGYAEEERTRAREEQDRLRREADERARKAREKELADLEQQAVEAEAASQDLSDREQRYMAEWFRNGGNATAAARVAGFKDPIAAAARLTVAEKMLAAIAAQEKANILSRQLEAKRAAPVEVTYEKVKADVADGDASRWSGEVLDEAAFIEAVIAGKHGIPRDTLMINPVRLNQYARDMHLLMDRWPGVRAKKTTSIR